MPTAWREYKKDRKYIVMLTLDKIYHAAFVAWREYKKDRKYIVMLTLDKIYHAAFVLKDVARRTDVYRHADFG